MSAQEDGHICESKNQSLCPASNIYNLDFRNKAQGGSDVTNVTAP